MHSLGRHCGENTKEYNHRAVPENKDVHRHCYPFTSLLTLVVAMTLFGKTSKCNEN